MDQHFSSTDLLTMLCERTSYLEFLIHDIQVKLKKAPEGTLVIAKRGNRIQYYHRLKPADRAGYYLDVSQMDLIQALAQKAYQKKVLRSALQVYKAITDFIKKYPRKNPEQIYEALDERRRLLTTPIRKTDADFIKDWKSLVYPKKPVTDEESAIQTPGGEYVRSKSEYIIASLLTQKGIPYRYEYPLQLSSIGTVHPDFTVLNPRSRREYVWEHLGMMDDPDYAKKALRRIKAYQTDGYYVGKNLILSFETRNHPINVKEVNALIEQYLT